MISAGRRSQIAILVVLVLRNGRIRSGQPRSSVAATGNTTTAMAHKERKGKGGLPDPDPSY